MLASPALQIAAMAVDKELLPAKLVYFVYFAGQVATARDIDRQLHSRIDRACCPQAACLPFLSLYFKRIDLSSAEVGVLVAIQPLVSIVSCPLFGAIADRTKRHKLVLVLCIVISVSLRLLLVLFWSKPALPFGTPFGWLLCLMVVCEFIGSPIPSIVDTLVISLLAKRDAVGDCTPGRHCAVVLDRVASVPHAAVSDLLASVSFIIADGKQRLWGAVSWGSTAPLIGAIVDHTSITAIFFAHALIQAVALVTVLLLPVSAPDDQRRLLRQNSSGVAEDSASAAPSAIDSAAVGNGDVELASVRSSAAAAEDGEHDAEGGAVAGAGSSDDALSLREPMPSDSERLRNGNGSASHGDPDAPAIPEAPLSFARACLTTARVLFSSRVNTLFFAVVLTLGTLYG